MVKSQIAFYGIQEANGFELLRLLRREFSLMSRPEALQYREACLKYTVKKSERHLLMDVLREIGFFFRPAPSWLPPGRSTRSIACCKLCCNG